jgi:hypothetical protein
MTDAASISQRDPAGVDAWEALKARLPKRSPKDEVAFQAMMARALKPLQPGDPRRHHYIPQFFQRRFADDNEQLVVTPLDGSKPITTHVKNVAVVKDLYTMRDTDLGETVAVERLLAEVDGEAAGAIARLLAGLLFPPMEPDRSNLALWFGLLFVRDPHTRRVMEAMSDHGSKLDLLPMSDPAVAAARLRELKGREPTDDEVADLVDLALHVNELDEVDLGQSHFVGAMLDVGLMSFAHLMSRRYLVVQFPEPGLVLSDRPVVLSQYPRNRLPGVGVGVINADEILIPLDRRTVLLLHKEFDLPDAFSTKPGDMTIDEVNQAVVGNATSELYCHPDDAERLKELRWPSPNRPLLQMSGGLGADIVTDGVNSPPTRRNHRRYRR